MSKGRRAKVRKTEADSRRETWQRRRETRRWRRRCARRRPARREPRLAERPRAIWKRKIAR